MDLEVIDLHLHPLFGYKYVFNPAMVRSGDGSWLLVCRLQNHLNEGFLGVCLLDEEFKPIRITTILRTSPSMGDASDVMLEDPRTFAHDGKIYLYHVESGAAYLYFCYTVFGQMDKDGFLDGQVILDHKKNRKAFDALKRLGRSDKEKQLPQKDWLVDKNWQFFIRENKYYCIYQAGRKNEVFRFGFPDGAIKENYLTYNDARWDYGRISGGAPPVLHPDGYYYSFFHSWTDWKPAAEGRSWGQRKYHIGVYVFERDPPFRIKKISRQPIISGSDDGRLAEWGHSVVFPGSAHFDAATGDWILAIGWNDYDSKVIRVRHEALAGGWIPVKKLSTLSVIRMEVKPRLMKWRRAAGRLVRG